jgi:Tfp pilus assembly ATPase PilU
MGIFSSRRESNINVSNINVFETKHVQYKLEEINKLIEKISILNQINKNRIFYQNLDSKIIDKFARKYNSYIGIKRFCIPIIGAISSGKSTLMNYLLPFHNILETGEKITTKFICIIRHCIINVPERGENGFHTKGRTIGEQTENHHHQMGNRYAY